jgi:hypothetical protein
MVPLVWDCKASNCNWCRDNNQPLPATTCSHVGFFLGQVGYLASAIDEICTRYVSLHCYIYDLR